MHRGLAESVSHTLNDVRSSITVNVGRWVSLPLPVIHCSYETMPLRGWQTRNCRHQESWLLQALGVLFALQCNIRFETALPATATPEIPQVTILMVTPTIDGSQLTARVVGGSASQVTARGRTEEVLPEAFAAYQLYLDFVNMLHRPQLQLKGHSSQQCGSSL